jgi:hypothetical protein
MILHPGTQIPVVSLKRLRGDADWLEHHLAAQHIAVVPGSPLAGAIAAAHAVADWQTNRNTFPATLRAPKAVAQAVGLSYLVRALVAANGRPDIANL